MGIWEDFSLSVSQGIVLPIVWSWPPFARVASPLSILFCPEKVLRRVFFFTRPRRGSNSYRRGRVFKLKFCLSVLLSVRNHFNISNLGPSNHPRIMSDTTYYTSLERGWHQRWQGQWQRHTHTDKYEDKDKDKYKMLKRPITCYIFEKQGVQGYQIWH